MTRENFSNVARALVIELLVERFRARPELVALLKSGNLSFSALDGSVPTSILNWLDARAEQHGLDLESGEFWRLLVRELGVGPEGAALLEALT